MDRREFLRLTLLTAASLLSTGLPRTATAQGLRRNESATSKKKVIVVGAGLAGLSAAFELVAAGHDVKVLEARTRPGGRVFTLRDQFADGLYAEAGAARIWDGHDYVLRYARRFSLALEPFFPKGGATIYRIGGLNLREGQDGLDLKSVPGLTDREKEAGYAGLADLYLGSLIEELGDPLAPGWPPAPIKHLDSLTYVDLLQKQGASPAAVRLMTLGIIDPKTDRTSALWMLRELYLSRENSRVFKISGGNDRLPDAFAKRLKDRIIYGARLVRIEQTSTDVRLIFEKSGKHQSLSCERAVLTAPFPVLCGIEVVPPFSASKRQAIERLGYESASRVFLQMRKRFWLERDLDGFAFTDLPGEIWHPTFDQPGPRGVLAALLLGDRSRGLDTMTEAARAAVALKHVESVFPGAGEYLEKSASKCWDLDPFSKGAWSVLKAHEVATLLPCIAAPEGRIHFAGEHTSAWNGWMEGALQSGNRVAREVHQAVKAAP